MVILIASSVDSVEISPNKIVPRDSEKSCTFTSLLNANATAYCGR